MTKKELAKNLEIYGNVFYSSTCPKLQLELIKKIVNCKNIADFTKITIINQYTKNLITNKIIINSINYYNNRV